MGSKSTKMVKMSKAERRRIAKRKRTIRFGATLGAVVAACVVCLVLMGSLNRPIDRQSTWTVADGAVNMDAAPDIAVAPTPLAAAAPEDDFKGMDENAPGGDLDDAEDKAFDAELDGMDGDAFDAELSDLDGDAFDADLGDLDGDGFDAEPVEAAADAPSDVAAQAVVTAAAYEGFASFDDGGEAGDFDAVGGSFDDPMAEAVGRAEPVRLTITAAGDCTLGGCLKHDTYKVFRKYVDDYGYDYFFKNVKAVFENDDLSIVNLEGPLTDVGTMTTKSGICFRGEPEWTAILTGAGIELCNYANNHNMDMGQEGFDRTLQALDDAHLGYCVYDKVYRADIKGVRVTALGFDKWANDKNEVVAAVQRERPNCDLLIVNIHWGREMHYEAMSDQKAMGHAIVDAGADLVIGTHPHVFGGVELYNGKYIAYSLGNFCFGGNTVPSDQRCMIFQQMFEIGTDGTVSDAGINIIPCLVSGNPKKNDFQPYILDAKPGTALLKKIARYSINLGSNAKWMPGSYPEQIGLIGPSAGSAAATANASPQVTSTAPSATEVPVLIPASEVFTEEDGFDTETNPQPGPTPTIEPLNGLGSRTLTAEEAAAFQEQIYQDQMGNLG